MLNSALLGLLLWTTATAAPVTVAHQGRLFDPTGGAITGAFDVTVRLYASEDASEALWTETHTDLAVVDGYYSVSLGTLSPLDAVYSSARFIGLQIGQQPELVPRQAVHRTRDALSAMVCDRGEVPRSLADGWVCGPARTHLGIVEVPVSFSGVLPNSWTKVNQATYVSFSWQGYDDYLAPLQQLDARLCASYTDSGDNTGRIDVRLFSPTSSSAVYSSAFGNTWSGSGLVHSQCTGWVATSSLQACASSACQMQMKHTQARDTRLYRMWWEVSAL